MWTAITWLRSTVSFTREDEIGMSLSLHPDRVKS